MASELLHTCYRIGNIERSVAFYQALGFEQRRQMTLKDGAINTFMGLPGDADRLELTWNPGVEAYELGTGYNHIAISTPDIHATLDQLAKQGIDPEKPPYQVREGGSLLCFVRDPDGYRVELIQRASPSIAEIDDVEDRLVRAQIAHDIDELELLLHPDLVYTDPAGGSGGKEEDLDVHRARGYELTRFDVLDRTYDRLGSDHVVARVRMLVESDVGNGEMRYTRNWVYDDGRWQVRVAHLTFLPDAQDELVQ